MRASSVLPMNEVFAEESVKFTDIELSIYRCLKNFNTNILFDNIYRIIPFHD